MKNKNKRDEEDAFYLEAKKFIEEENRRLGDLENTHLATRAMYRVLKHLHQEITFEAIADHLNRAVDEASMGLGPQNLKDALIKQAVVLDAAFNHLCAEAVIDKYDMVPRFQAAFTAQRLYRQCYDKLNGESELKKRLERTEQRLAGDWSNQTKY